MPRRTTRAAAACKAAKEKAATPAPKKRARPALKKLVETVKDVVSPDEAAEE